MIQNIGVDSQMQVIKRCGELLTASHSEKRRCSMAEDGRYICLRYHSKGEFIMSCTLSHAPLQRQIRDNLIKFIGIFRANFDPARKQNFYEVKPNCYSRNGDNEYNGQNPDRHTPMNGAGGGFGKANHVRGVRQDVNHGGVRGTRGGPGHNTPFSPPRQIKTAGRSSELLVQR